MRDTRCVLVGLVLTVLAAALLPAAGASAGTGNIERVAVIAPSVSTGMKAREICLKAGWRQVRPRQAQVVLVVVRSTLFNPLDYSYECYKELIHDAEGQLNISGPKFHIYLYAIDDDLEISQLNHRSFDASDGE